MPDRLRVKLGDAELEVEGDRVYIEERLQWFLGFITKAGPGSQTAPGAIPASQAGMRPPPMRSPSPAEFLRQKRPNGGKETLIALAYYLEHFEGVTTYTQQQVNEAAARAKTKSIHSQYFTTAVKEGLLRADRGTYSMTLTGEDVVNSLPAAMAQ